MTNNALNISRSLLAAAVASALLAACGGGDEGGTTAAPTSPGAPAAPAAPSGPTAAPVVPPTDTESVRFLTQATMGASDADIVQAMRLLFERVKTVAEPSGACALAALLAGRVPDARGLRIGVVISGGNVSAERFVSLMADVPEG